MNLIHSGPSLEEIRANTNRLRPYLRRTPMIPWQSALIERCLGKDTRVHLKLELFQVTGSFKARGALTSVLALSPEERRHGVTAASAGNHAIAVAFAAHTQNINARIAIFKPANPMRIAMTKELGADVILTETGHEAFALAETMTKEEGRVFVHPFEGRNVTLGNASVGLEIAEDLPKLDAVIIALGGGGLASGVAHTIKQIYPDCLIYGVEPTGSDVVRRSLDKGTTLTLEKVTTIADSLGAPMTRPYSFALCQKLLEDVVLVDDDEIAVALTLMQLEAKLAVEPAAAAPAAALLGPLREKLRGKTICLIVCGGNIDTETYSKLLLRGQNHLSSWTKELETA